MQGTIPSDLHCLETPPLGRQSVRGEKIALHVTHFPSISTLKLYCIGWEILAADRVTEPRCSQHLGAWRCAVASLVVACRKSRTRRDSI